MCVRSSDCVVVVFLYAQNQPNVIFIPSKWNAIVEYYNTVNGYGFSTIIVDWEKIVLNKYHLILYFFVLGSVWRFRCQERLSRCDFYELHRRCMFCCFFFFSLADWIEIQHRVGVELIRRWNVCIVNLSFEHKHGRLYGNNIFANIPFFVVVALNTYGS